MSEREDSMEGNPNDVRLGDVFGDRDTRRPQRRLEVVNVEGGVASLRNLVTHRTTRVRLDRLAERTRNSHGYLRVSRAATPGTVGLDGVAQPSAPELRS